MWEQLSGLSSEGLGKFRLLYSGWIASIFQINSRITFFLWRHTHMCEEGQEREGGGGWRGGEGKKGKKKQRKMLEEGKEMAMRGRTYSLGWHQLTLVAQAAVFDQRRHPAFETPDWSYSREDTLSAHWGQTQSGEVNKYQKLLYKTARFVTAQRIEFDTKEKHYLEVMEW